MPVSERSALLVLAFLLVSCKGEERIEPTRSANLPTVGRENAASGAFMSESDSAQGSEPVVDLGDGRDPNRKTTVRRVDELPAAEQAGIRAIRNSARVKAWEARTREIAARGPLALVLIDRPLGKNVLTQVYLNASPPVSRFFVVTGAALHDEVIDRATSLAFKYERDYPGDVGQVKFTLFADGSFVRESATNGRLEARQFFKGFYAEPNRRSEQLKRVAQQTKATEVPGIGRAKVLSLGDAP